jgi:hypothetical protein
MCRHCGKPMAFATRITMPRQTVYRCDPCSEQAWILDPRPRHRLSDNKSRRSSGKAHGDASPAEALPTGVGG